MYQSKARFLSDIIQKTASNNPFSIASSWVWKLAVGCRNVLGFNQLRKRNIIQGQLFEGIRQVTNDLLRNKRIHMWKREPMVPGRKIKKVHFLFTDFHPPIAGCRLIYHRGNLEVCTVVQAFQAWDLPDSFPAVGPISARHGRSQHSHSDRPDWFSMA